MVNAYVPNGGSNPGTVSVIDTATDTVSATITVGHGPEGAAVTPDGAHTYVTNNTDGTVSVIANATGTVSSTITVGTAPVGAAITPDGSTAYVVNQNSNNVSVIDTALGSVSATVTVGGSPQEVAITPDGTRAYVTNNFSGTVSVINTASNAVLATITVGTGTNGVAFTSDGAKAYVANSGSNSVSVINTGTSAVSSTITTGIGNSPFGVAISPDGTKAYVSNNGDGTVSVIDIGTNTVKSGAGYPITVGNKPVGVAFTPDGGKAYVANVQDGTVSVIDAATDAVTATVTVGSSPHALAQFIQPSSVETDMIAPQGLLTLSSTAPVMTADATNKSTIYYLPYQGNGVPVYNGAQFANWLLGSSGISLALDSNAAHTGYHQSTKLFDIFAFIKSGALTLGTGPAWTNNTTRANAITQKNGLWVNSASITLRFGTNSGDTTSVTANQATYLGTMYATADGQTGMAYNPAIAAGGTNNILGLYNAYNRIAITATCWDSTASWTNTGSAVQPANYDQGGAGTNLKNRISWVDGLQQSNVEASYQVDMYSSSSSVQGSAGVSVNWTSGASAYSGFHAQSISTNNVPLLGRVTAAPLLGFNFVQAVERNDSGTGTITYQADTIQGLTLRVEM
jgi:YVTN family beta-propeller protein